MEDPKASAVARLKEANNVLVTVSTNPSVDQLAGVIGMTLLLNKLNKHATAVFSGDIPSTIEFLQPEQTLEKDTNSLRDFIISLDKDKADKLRYKVEEKLVRIFITPYHTSIGQDDLEFSMGDFNVDVILAVGVHEQQDLDQAIAAHGRILHDATIISVNTQPNGNLGTISWVDEKASSLCEMLTDIGLALKNDVLDGQMSTALLTGIVAETERFSNQKTSSATMSLSAKLMSAGANQQLVATKLQESADNMLPETQPDNIPPAPDSEESDDEGGNDDGSLRIDHNEPNTPSQDAKEPTSPEPTREKTADEQPSEEEAKQKEDKNQIKVPKTPKPMTEPPSMQQEALTTVGQPDQDDANVNPLSLPPVETPLLSHHSAKKSKHKSSSGKKTSKDDVPQPVKSEHKAPPHETPPAKPKEDDNKTLEDIEKAVESPHLTPKESDKPVDTELKAAQDAVASAKNDEEIIDESGAQSVNLDLGHDTAPEAIPTTRPSSGNENQYLDVTKINEETGLPESHVPEPGPPPAIENDGTNSSNMPPPPPVPPPMMPPPPPAQPTMKFGGQAPRN